MQPILSVIIPVYRDEPYLMQCAGSVLQQSMPDLELILVDDASPDGSPALCDALAEKDARVRVIHLERNSGPGAARNSGMKIARGKWITFVDGDDFIDIDLYERALEHDSDDIDEIRYAYRRYPSDYRATEMPVPDSVLLSGSESMKNVALAAVAPLSDGSDACFDLGGSVSTALYRASVIHDNDIIFYSSRDCTSEDILFNIDFLAHARAVRFLSWRPYHYRWNRESLTQAPGLEYLKEVEKFCEEAQRRLSGYGWDNDADVRLTSYALRLVRAYEKRLMLSGRSSGLLKECVAEQSDNKFLRSVAGKESLDSLPWRQRLFIKALLGGRFSVLRALVCLQEGIRSVRNLMVRR